jgi:hypothetical protein
VPSRHRVGPPPLPGYGMNCMTGVLVATGRGVITRGAGAAVAVGAGGTAVGVTVGASSSAATVDCGVMVDTALPCLSPHVPPTDDAKIKREASTVRSRGMRTPVSRLGRLSIRNSDGRTQSYHDNRFRSTTSELIEQDALRCAPSRGATARSCALASDCRIRGTGIDCGTSRTRGH